MTAIMLRGDARSLPLPDASVDLVITSPPYFGLRSYTDGGEHYEGQVGSEATPAEYVAALVACTAEWVRVLKPSGSIFVNLGDKYAGDSRPGGALTSTLNDPKRRAHTAVAGGRKVPGTPKSLLGLPWRYALACTDQLGLILRAEIIWAKPNGLPESVQDRVRRAHEQVFHFTRLPRYYSAVDEIREACESFRDASHDRRKHLPWMNGYINSPPNPLGKLPGSVWDIPSQPLTVPAHLGVDHFAAFPMELPRRLVLGWSPPGVCVECGEGRRPVTERTTMVVRPSPRRLLAQVNGNASRTATGGTVITPPSATITGYACACPQPTAPTRPAVVLDPFGGTGTTALIAHAYGRHGISIDRSADYCRLARWRTSDPAERARALEVPKPPVVPVGQESLF